MEAISWQLFAGNWWFQLGGFTNQILLSSSYLSNDCSGSPSDIIIMISKKFCLTSSICQKLCFPRSLVEGFENYTGHRSYPIHNDLPTENTIRSDFHKSKKYNTAVKILFNWNADADFDIFLRYLAIVYFSNAADLRIQAAGSYPHFIGPSCCMHSHLIFPTNAGIVETVIIMPSSMTPFAS